MVTTLVARPAWADLWADDDSIDVVTAAQSRLSASLNDAEPSTWVWCFRCERAFQRGDVHVEGTSVRCAYLDCDGSGLDFWQWDAYRAFVGCAPAPSRGVRFAMAQGA